MSTPSQKHLIIGSAFFIFLVVFIISGILFLLPNTQDDLTSAPDGSNKAEMLVFFSKIDMPDCGQVFGVARPLIETADEQLFLEELLKGPRFSEIQEGFRSNLANGIIIQSFEVKDKIAYVDFNQAFNNVAGSCRVEAIRAQVEKTLEQFDSIDRVVITVNGNAEEVLQP